MVTKPTKIGRHTFSAAFTRAYGGLKIPYILLDAAAEWLGPGWTASRCKAVLELEPWMSEPLCSTADDGAIGLSPLGIAMIVAYGAPDSLPALKTASATLVTDWIERRAQTAKAWG